MAEFTNYLEWKWALQAEAERYLLEVARRFREVGVPQRMVEVELTILVRRAMKSLQAETAAKAPGGGRHGRERERHV